MTELEDEKHEMFIIHLKPLYGNVNGVPRNLRFLIFLINKKTLENDGCLNLKI